MKKISDLSSEETILAFEAFLSEKPFPQSLFDYDEKEVYEEIKRALEEDSSSHFWPSLEKYRKDPRGFRELYVLALPVPSLRYSSRRGDWDLLPESLRDSMLYAYLFDAMTLRELDESFLLEDPLKTKGFLSVRILHYMGVTGDFRGLYSDFKLREAIASLEHQGQEYIHLVRALERYEYSLYRKEKYSENDNLESVVRDGGRFLHYTTKYERSPLLRKEAMEIHGKKCMACGFDFEASYGEQGRDFIEVHHLVGFPDLNQDLFVDARSDMICLCSNCHRMVHRKPGEVLSLEDLRSLLKGKKNP